MQNASFPHMEWAKAQGQNPPALQLGFSGAAAPEGALLAEHGAGHPELRRRIAARYGVPIDHLYLMGGTSLANFVTLAALSGPETTIAVEHPRYAPLAEIPKGLGARVLDWGFLPDGRRKPIPRAASLAVCSSPHNPTGLTLREEDWRRLSRFADSGGMVLVDEVYRDLQAQPPPVAASRHPHFLTTASFTKAYGLGALRLGWVMAAPEVLERIRRVDNLVSVNVSTPSAEALLETWPRLNPLRRKAVRPVQKNLEVLRKSGLSFPEPDAGLTAFVDVRDGDFVAAELEKEGIGVARGSFFGAPRCVRVFLGAPARDFRKGIEALVRVAAAAKAPRRKG